MMPAVAQNIWFAVPASLALETGLLALMLGLALRGTQSPGWRRTLCQAALLGALLITVCEVSGAGRAFAGWVSTNLARRHGTGSLARIFHAEPKMPPPGSRRRESALTSEKRKPAPTHVGGYVNHDTSGLAPLPFQTGGDETWALTEKKASGSPFADLLSRNPVPVPERATPAPEPSGASPALPNDLSGHGSAVPRAPVVVAIAQWLWLCWWSVAALLVARALLARFLFFVFRLRRKAVGNPELLARARSLAGRLNVPRRFRLIESPGLTTPIAFGVIQPAVGLPVSFTEQFDVARQQAMLAHELAHLAARDPFWCLLADLLASLLWWHPAVWWMRRQLHLASETAADEASLLIHNGPGLLAECLVEFGQRLAGPSPAGQLRVSGFRSHLGRRVHRLLHLEDRPWSAPSPCPAALIRTLAPMATIAVLVLCTAWIAPADFKKGDVMTAMKLNWKQSLATFSLVAGLTSPNASPAGAAKTSPGADNQAQVEPTSTPAPATAATDSRPAEPAAPATSAEGPASAVTVPAVTAASRAEPEPAKPGARTEARLKKIVLHEVRFEDLPLTEVLAFLRDEALKLDPEKTGVNFLIAPNPRAIPGQPWQPAAAPVDISEVPIKFSLSLRNVTMRDVLDAIVRVSEKPIEYSLEDYGVVFSPRTSPAPNRTGWNSGLSPVWPAPARGALNVPAQRTPAASTDLQLLGAPQVASGRGSPPAAEPSPASSPPLLKPHRFNIDFGPCRPEPSKQTGPAAAGQAGDFWNSVAVSWNDDHTEAGLKAATGEPSPIEVQLINLGGCWGNGGGMGVKDPMLDTFTYPAMNKGGDSTVILYNVPAGRYNLYLYGHGSDPRNPQYNGDYTVTVNGHSYGRKQTSHGLDALRNKKWVEGSQYVKFSGLKVSEGDKLEILIQPGGQVSYSGRTFADAMICGLQLVPAR